MANTYTQGVVDYNATPKTDQEILNALKNIRDNWVTSGRFMEKNWTTSDGNTIFLRSPEDVEAYINLYQGKVNQANGAGGYLVRVNHYA